MTRSDFPEPSVGAHSAAEQAKKPNTAANHHYRKAFSWGVIWLAGLALIFTLVYHNFSAEGFGRFVGMTMVASAITGWIANRRAIARSFVTVGGIYFLVLFSVWLISSLGAFRGAT